MRYVRMPIEVESPEEYGYARIRYNLSESSVADQSLADLGLSIPTDVPLLYGEHRGRERLRELLPRRAGHHGRRWGAVHRRDLAAVEGRPSGRDPAQLRHQPRDPRAIGCQTTHIELAFEDGFRVDVNKVAAALTPARIADLLLAAGEPAMAVPYVLEAARRSCGRSPTSRPSTAVVSSSTRPIATSPSRRRCRRPHRWARM